MKRIMIATVIIFSLTTSGILAYNKNVKLNTQEYINMLNTTIGELNDELESKEKATLGNIFSKGIDEGYIVPSINNDTKLKESISGLIDNIKETKIINKDIQLKHNELMHHMEDLTILLENTIECKNKILKSKENSLKKGQMLLTEDGKKVRSANNKIDEINNLYKEINNFIK